MNQAAPESVNVSTLRICDECGAVDDHPRHNIFYARGDGVTPPEVGAKALENARAYGEAAVAHILAQVQDSAVMSFHMDCCRARGCFDGACNVVLSEASGKGDELRSSIQAAWPDGITPTVFGDADPENPQPDGPPVPPDVQAERDNLEIAGIQAATAAENPEA